MNRRILMQHLKRWGQLKAVDGTLTFSTWPTMVDVRNLDRAIESMREDAQQLLRMRFMKGWPCHRIAAELFISERTLYRRIVPIFDSLIDWFDEKWAA